MKQLEIPSTAVTGKGRVPLSIRAANRGPTRKVRTNLIDKLSLGSKKLVLRVLRKIYKRGLRALKKKKRKYSNPQNTKWELVNKSRIHKLVFQKKLRNYAKSRHLHKLKYAKLGKGSDSYLTSSRLYNSPAKTEIFPGIGTYVGGMAIGEHDVLPFGVIGAGLRQNKISTLTPQKYNSVTILDVKSTTGLLKPSKAGKPTKLLRPFTRGYCRPGQTRVMLRKANVQSPSVRVSTIRPKLSKFYHLNSRTQRPSVPRVPVDIPIKALRVDIPQKIKIQLRKPISSAD